MLELKYSKQSLKFLKKCDRALVKRLLDKLEELRENPFPQNMKRLAGNKLFRIRIGKHRVMYEVDHGANVLGIIKIDKRERVYD